MPLCFEEACLETAKVSLMCLLLRVRWLSMVPSFGGTLSTMPSSSSSGYWTQCMKMPVPVQTTKVIAAATTRPRWVHIVYQQLQTLTPVVGVTLTLLGSALSVRLFFRFSQSLHRQQKAGPSLLFIELGPPHSLCSKHNVLQSETSP